MEREPRADRRKEEVADVRKIEAIHAGEHEEVERAFVAPAVQFEPDQKEHDIEKGICNLQDFGEPRGAEVHEPARRVDAEQPPVGRDQDVVIVPSEVDRLDHEVELLEREEHRRRDVPIVNHREHSRAGGVPRPPEDAYRGHDRRVDEDHEPPVRDP